MQHKLTSYAPPTGLTSSPGPLDIAEDPVNLSPSRRCSQAERASLKDILLDWRDVRWSTIANDNPFLSWQWVLDDENIDILVSKAHKIVNASAIDAALVRSLIAWITDAENMRLLVAVLNDFRTAFRSRSDKQRKKANTSRWPRDGSPTPSSRHSSAREQNPGEPSALGHRTHQFQLSVPKYEHEPTSQMTFNDVFHVGI
ncbi:hypothetical protein C2E23DRAFT_855301 [Lenzites betulinus]|nr:hypothetical protein C2E23DRAFT_855301 [Lenzites betulinus]